MSLVTRTMAASALGRLGCTRKRVKIYAINFVVALFFSSNVFGLDKPVLTVPSSDLDGDYNVSWTSVAGATRYEVWRDTKVNGNWPGTWSYRQVVSSKYLQQTAIPNGSYRYVVSACDSSCGNYNFSQAKPIDVTLSSPARPTLTVPTVNSGANYIVNWTSEFDSTQYVLWRQTKVGSTWPSNNWVPVYDGPATQVTEGSIPAGEHRYVVRSCNKFDCSIFTGAENIDVAYSGIPTVFPHPNHVGVTASNDYEVFVNGQEVFVHQDFRLNVASPQNPWLGNMRVSEQAYAIFDFNGPVYVDVKFKNALLLNQIGSFRIAPAKKNVVPWFDTPNDTVSFALDSASNLTIDPYGDGTRVLHLFTNKPDTNVPSPNSPGVTYISFADTGYTGVYDINSPITLGSNEILYIEGGVVLRPLVTQNAAGTICPLDPSPPPGGATVLRKCNQAAIKIQGDDVIIRGRGVISGDRAISNGHRFPMISSGHPGNTLYDGIQIKDVVVARTTGWSVHLYKCTNANVKDLRVLGFYANSDGILLNQCTGSVVDGSFVHVADDGLEIKSGNLPSQNILIKNSQVWVDVGAAVGLTHEIQSTVENITFDSITILRNTHLSGGGDTAEAPYRGSIMVKPATGGLVKNILFKDIVIEDHRTTRPVILVNNQTNSLPSASPIETLIFQNISATVTKAPTSDAKVWIYDEAWPSGVYEGITLDNVVINGARINNLQSPRLHADNVDTNEIMITPPPPGC